MAYASAGAELDCDGGVRVGAEVGRGEGGDSAGGCGLVCAGGKALARGDGNDSDDAYCGSGEVGWEGGGVDGEGE